MSTSLPDAHDSPSNPPLWLAVVASAAAGGMAWGIRGQYGHETGAMIASVLVGLVLVHLFIPGATSLVAARGVALCALGISLGGSMTYGQTVGLTHDAELVDNWAALGWGMLGLALKGGIWIAFAGALLGMGLGEKKYRPLEMVFLVGGLIICLLVGLWMFNRPFDPANRELPPIYFSDDWYWEPDANLKPRPERWGGLLLALVGLVAYAGLVRKDRLAARLTGWGFLGGALGFPVGQCIQAYHAWNAPSLRQGWFAALEPHINWWNFMETTFGAVFGAVLALGLWLNRRLLVAGENEPTVDLKPAVEWLLVAVHVPALVAWNFATYPWLDMVADHALPMIAIPLVGVVGGRLWPYLLTLPIVAIPIAGKTVRHLYHEEAAIGWPRAYGLYLVLPLIVATVAALLLARQAASRPSARTYSRWALLIATWLYFSLNFAFFHYPWPWQPWTGRTPNAIVFAICAIILTAVAFRTDGT